MPLADLNPTELGLMKVLWRRGRMSARELHDAFGAQQSWAYSTTRTVLDRMARKRLVQKAPFHGLNLYSPAISRVAGMARQVRDFAERVLETDPAPVVSLFAESADLSGAEIAELEALLAEHEREEKP